MPRVALVYTYEPSGHSEAARAIEAALGGESARRVNLSSDLHPVLGPVVAKAYLELIQRTPGVWEALYDNARLAKATEEMRGLVHLLNGFRLTARLAELKPDLVACTHALPCGWLAAHRRRGRFHAPLVAVLTDYAAHAYWIHPEVDLYLVASPETKSELTRRGVDEARIRVTGIPIDPRFSQLPSRETARRRLRLREDRPVIFVSGGSKGLGPLSEVVELLAQRAPKAQLLIACGNNSELHSRLRRSHAENPNVHPLRYHRRSAEIMAASDILVGKAGGLTLAESLAAGVPAVLFEPIPGQERRNTHAMLKGGAALEAPSLESLGTLVRSLLDKPRELVAMRERCRSLGRPTSANEAAKALKELLQSSPL